MPCYAVFVLEENSRVVVNDLFELLEKTATFFEKIAPARARSIKAALTHKNAFEDGNVDWELVLPLGQEIADYIFHRESLDADCPMDVSFHHAENEEQAMFEAFDHWQREYSIAGNPNIHPDISPTKH